MSLLRRSRKRSVFAKPRDCRRAWASPRTSPTCPTRRRCELPPHPDDRRQGEVGSVLLTQALSRCTRSTSGPPGIQQPRQRGSTSDSASRRWASARNSYSDPAARGIPPLRPTSRVVHIGDSDEPSGPVRSDRQNRIDACVGRHRCTRSLGLEVRDDLLAEETENMEHLLVLSRPDGAQ